MTEPDWAPGTNGAWANQKDPPPSESKRPSDMLPYKNVPARTKRQQVNNVKGAIQHATPEEYLHGMSWYQTAKSEIDRNVTSAVDAAQTRRGDRATAATARLSPSGGGMTWEKNIPAARAAAHLSESDVTKVEHGNRAPVRSSELNRASNADISKAYSTLHGGEPEDALTTRKIGHFYTNLNYSSGKVPDEVKAANPKFYSKIDPRGATVDGRADSILKGRHVSWKSHLQDSIIRIGMTTRVVSISRLHMRWAFRMLTRGRLSHGP